MGAQSFNFAPKFHPNVFCHQIMHFWTKSFEREESFLTAQNVGREKLPLHASATCHDITVCIFIFATMLLNIFALYCLDQTMEFAIVTLARVLSAAGCRLLRPGSWKRW